VDTRRSLQLCSELSRQLPGFDAEFLKDGRDNTLRLIQQREQEVFDLYLLVSKALSNALGLLESLLRLLS
jgi:hypothetical protein